jgi:hypothetical protein
MQVGKGAWLSHRALGRFQRTRQVVLSSRPHIVVQISSWRNAMQALRIVRLITLWTAAHHEPRPPLTPRTLALLAERHGFPKVH